MKNIKFFNIPSFEEWNQNDRDFLVQVGEYYCCCRASCWGKNYVNYEFAISTSNNPLNIYSKRIYSERFHFENGKLFDLKFWYENIRENYKADWTDYIMKNYFE